MRKRMKTDATGGGAGAGGADGGVPVCLTIAGSDSGGGAGIQADLQTFAACGVHGVSAITCLTAQNPAGVSGLFPTPPSFVLEQARQTTRFFALGAVKTGMLLNREIILAAAEFIAEQRAANPALPFVLDPVMVSTSGARLLEPEAVATLRDTLFPLATLITPNLDEAAVLLGEAHIATPDAMEIAARKLAAAHGCAVLLKGGHLQTDTLTDALVFPEKNGSEKGVENRVENGAEGVLFLTASRCPATNTHGSGCTYAAAVTAFLAHGATLRVAVSAAHAYLQRGIHAPMRIAGHAFIAHRV